MIAMGFFTIAMGGSYETNKKIAMRLQGKSLERHKKIKSPKHAKIMFFEIDSSFFI